MKSELKVEFKNRSDVENDCAIWANNIRDKYQPDFILFIAKSGFLFGKALAKEFGCPLADIVVSRPQNKKMDLIKRFVPKVPKKMLSYYLQKKAFSNNRSYQGDRIIHETPSMKCLKENKYSKILIVDDSVDTGGSLLKTIDILNEIGYEGKYKVASYCVLKQALDRVNVDFYMYLDRIVITCTSRYSVEYKNFVADYESWKQGFE